VHVRSSVLAEGRELDVGGVHQDAVLLQVGGEHGGKDGREHDRLPQELRLDVLEKQDESQGLMMDKQIR
jgi:hypothetical protein